MITNVSASIALLLGFQVRMRRTLLTRSWRVEVETEHLKLPAIIGSNYCFLSQTQI